MRRWFDLRFSKSHLTPVIYQNFALKFFRALFSFTMRWNNGKSVVSLQRDFILMRFFDLKSYKGKIFGDLIIRLNVPFINIVCNF